MAKKGFTLMELLLVVAVLAIVAAAAAPTFFGGAKEAMDEARKSSFMSAYQNTISGANLLMGIAASQGTVPTKDAVLTFTDKSNTEKKLEDYAPRAARVFTNKNGKSYIFSAVYNGTDVDIVYDAGDASAEPTTLTNKIKIDATNKTVEAALLAAWDAIKDVAN